LFSINNELDEKNFDEKNSKKEVKELNGYYFVSKPHKDTYDFITNTEKDKDKH
jgi:hypothetical protein